VTVGELLLTVGAVVVVIVGGLWLWAWWTEQHGSRDGPPDGEWK
jgi:hypothetical protein